MTKLYWAWHRDDEGWTGPRASVAECIAEARYESEPGHTDPAIWVAPVDAETDDDDAFWDALADHVLVWGVENAEESLVEDGWLDHEEAWLSGGMPKDPRSRIVARVLREVLGPRPEWRTVDTAKAERVEL